MASRTLNDAWNDFDKATNNLNPLIVQDLKNSSTRWTVRQIDLVLDLLKSSTPTTNPSKSISREPYSTPTTQQDSPKFGTIHNAMLWAGFTNDELFRIDPKDDSNLILLGKLDFDVTFRIDIDGEGNLLKTVAPNTPTQSTYKKKFDSQVRTLQTFVMPHDRILLNHSDNRFIELLKLINIPIRVI